MAKGTENGIMSEPPVTVFVRHWHPPDLALAEIPGRWRNETALPPERTGWQAWYCGAERLAVARTRRPAGHPSSCGTCRRPGWRPGTGGAS